jgi:hypothetical protein
MTMKFTISKTFGLTAAALILVTATAARADDSFNRLVSRWKVEREQIVKHITQAWLRGERPETMRGDLMQLSQIESGLASSPGAFLYVGEIENPNDLAGSVTAVARTYLKQRGALVDSAEFLRGKTFYVVREQVVPKKYVKTQNYTYGGRETVADSQVAPSPEKLNEPASEVTETERTETRYQPSP